MPHANGTIDAIAVTSSHGIILISFYTIMMKAIITQFWMGIVLFGVGLYLHRHSSPHDSDSSATTTTIGLWNVKHSPQQVIYLMTRRTWAVGTLREVWYPLIWFAVAAMALAASLAVPIVKTQDLKVGTVAPVNPESVFVPNYQDPVSTMHETAQQLTLVVPAALRAVGAAGTVPANTVFTSNISTPSVNGTVVQFDYSYGISGSDFGLQRTPELWLNVSGSCITDYTWYRGVDPTTSGDAYYLWNSPEDAEVVYLSSDNGPPFASAFFGPVPSNSVNSTYALLVSSVGRQSISSSTDPWYFTIGQQDPTWPNIVNRGRPPFSCWETNIWSFRGNTSDILGLRNLTDNRLSVPVYVALGQNLFGPMIYTLTERIARSSLASSATVVGAGFDAGQSSIITDMTRLINSSYIATRNILSDSTTMSAEGQRGLLNAFLGNDSNILPGSDEFVISSPNIITLSVRVLIIVPAVFVGVIVLLTVLAFLPDPWRSSKELNATRIHALKRQNTKSKTKNVRESK